VGFAVRIAKSRTRFGAAAAVALAVAGLWPGAAPAQGFQPASPDGWRAWLFSAAPPTPERRLDLGVTPDDRANRVGAVVTYPVIGGVHAGFRLDGTIDAAGAHANTALLVLRLPLFGAAETPARATSPLGTGAGFLSGAAVVRPPPARAATSGEGLLTRLLDPAFYWQALRLDVPMRWLTGAEESPSAVFLPPLRAPRAAN
jgi:hypothetical protein